MAGPYVCVHAAVVGYLRSAAVAGFGTVGCAEYDPAFDVGNGESGSGTAVVADEGDFVGVVVVDAAEGSEVRTEAAGEERAVGDCPAFEIYQEIW